MNILPDITAKFLTNPIAHQQAALESLSLQLITAAQWSLTPGRESDAIALAEHVVDTWKVEHGQTGDVTWH